MPSALSTIHCGTLAILTAAAATAADEAHRHPHAVPEIIVTADPLGAIESHIAAPTDGYTLLNVDAGRTFRVGGVSDVTLFARGSNLADQTARRHTSFVKDLAPLPGVSGLVGLRARF